LVEAVAGGFDVVTGGFGMFGVLPDGSTASIGGGSWID